MEWTLLLPSFFSTSASQWESEGQGWWENPCGRVVINLKMPTDYGDGDT